MDKHYQLHITSPTTEVNVDTVDPTEIARIVSLAGLPPQTVAPAVTPSAPITHDVHADDLGMGDDIGHDGIDDEELNHIEPSMDDSLDDSLEEDVAEYDYGYQEFKDEGHEVDPTIFYQRGSKLPQRIVKGGQGDNPLISELHRHLVSQYKSFLAETDKENDTGVMSPLSDPTKPGFDKDPFSGETPVTDGSRSPMSTIKRQHAFK
jgi:hypothetical protein